MTLYFLVKFWQNSDQFLTTYSKKKYLLQIKVHLAVTFWGIYQYLILASYSRYIRDRSLIVGHINPDIFMAQCKNLSKMCPQKGLSKQIPGWIICAQNFPMWNVCTKCPTSFIRYIGAWTKCHQLILFVTDLMREAMTASSRRSKLFNSAINIRGKVYNYLIY